MRFVAPHSIRPPFPGRPAPDRDWLRKASGLLPTGGSAMMLAEGMGHTEQKGQDLLRVGLFPKLVPNTKRICLGLTRRIVINDARKIG